MSIRRLKTLIAVAEKGTFAAAATVRFVSHAAVSQQMKTLEDELGVSIFDRSRRSPVLNQHGRNLVAKARDVVHAYNNMVSSVHDDDRVVGELVFGAVSTCMTSLVPRVVGMLKRRYPKLHVRVVPGLSAELQIQVERGYLDAAVLSEPPFLPNGLSWRAFAEEPLILLASLEEESDDPEWLLESRPFIRFNRRAWLGRQIDEWLQANKLNIREGMELDTLESISSMVFYQLGVSIVPRRCVPSARPLPLKRIPLGPSARPRILGVVARKDGLKFQLLEVLLAELVELVESAGEVKAVHG